MDSDDSIESLADSCVQCGFCLPHCPTYQQTGKETHSPRGRIALMRGLAEGKLSANKAWRDNVESCLTCGACEEACPADVSYISLLLKTRQTITEHSLSVRLMDFFIRHPILRPLLKVASWAPWPPMTGLLPKKLHHTPIAPLTEAAAPMQGKVEVLTDCMHYLVDTTPVRAATYILSQWGFEVSCPKQGQCCGSWFTHTGNAKEANKRLRPENPNIPLLSLASGCQCLQEGRAQDILGFLLQHWPDSITLKPVTGLVGVHLPCSQRDRQAPLALLRKIPGLKVSLLSQGHCCGAGATTVLRHPDLSSKIAKKTLEAIKSQPFDWIASNNTGCRLHLGSQENTPLLVHPLILLAKSLGWETT